MHPNPIKQRTKYKELVAGWECSVNDGPWTAIRIPFCPQSELSGIAYTDLIHICKYRVSFLWIPSVGRTFLHFGAVDYETIVYVNGVRVGFHKGGYTPFAFDISAALRAGDNELYIEVFDENQGIPFGKQTYKDKSFGCFYTRTTGIWQPVWIEETPQDYIQDFYFTPNVRDSAVQVELLVSGHGQYEINVFFDGRQVGSKAGEIDCRTVVTIPLSETHLWSVGVGNLYEVVLRYEGDEVHSYFGLREVGYREDGRFYLNGEDTYQRLVLDQGYYPDGLYTAPSEEAMQRDIRLGMRLGFNGARLHQKVFDPRFLYFCDRMGYMVWGEFPSWGVDYSNLTFLRQFLTEWGEVLRRDFNHPCIIQWCPLNEVWGDWEDKTKTRDVRFVDSVYDFTKRFDATRPCVDASGGHHGHKTDLYDFHCYEPYEKLEGYLNRLETRGEIDVPLLYRADETLRYAGGPVNLSECGGFFFGDSSDLSWVDTVNECAVTSQSPWGYGESENNGDRFVERVTRLFHLIGRYNRISGYCYTQLYDVEQEQNGFYRYDRSDKLTEAQKNAIRDVQVQIGVPAKASVRKQQTLVNQK